jgi:predicted lactoylglutathione lyase
VIAHTSLPVRDFQKSKTFASKAQAHSAIAITWNTAGGRLNDGKNTDFWISKERSVVPTHVAFEAGSREKVVAFQKAAVAAGGKDNGGPGYRDYWPGYYAAFVHDPDGNNIEAVWYDYSKSK